MKQSALMTALQMDLPAYARAALDFERHPQQRTLAFHDFYGAPIRSQRPDRQFIHMDEARVAFRATFLLSEVLELFEKGLGVKLSVNIEDDGMEGEAVFLPISTKEEEAEFCNHIAWSLKHGMGKGKRDLVEVVDALGDLNVVVNGFAIELGVDMLLIDQEICASNFTKAGEDGKPIIGDGSNGPLGKVLKGPNFVEPQIALVLGLED